MLLLFSQGGGRWPSCVFVVEEIQKFVANVGFHSGVRGTEGGRRECCILIRSIHGMKGRPSCFLVEHVVADGGTGGRDGPGGVYSICMAFCVFFFSFIHGEKVGFRDFPSPDLASAMLIFVPTVVHAPSHSTHLDLPRSLFGRATKTFCLRLYNTIVSPLRLLGFLFVCPIQEFRRRNVHGAFVKWVKPIVPVLVTNVPTLFYTNYQHEDLIVD